MSWRRPVQWISTLTLTSLREIPDVTSCCSTFGEAAEEQFNKKKAAEELARYRKNGPGPTTCRLQDAVAKSGALSGSLLDIGSGIGSLTFGLLERGASSAVAVDASSAYIAAAVEEADRRGYSHAIQFVHGDFVTITSEISPATVVTLDRVVCCYPAFASLLEEALRHADRCFALSYPRDVWYVRVGVVIENLRRRFAAKSFRTFVHSAVKMEQIIRRAGFDPLSRSETWMWSADVYIRSQGRADHNS
jgi:predicted RNA methylase